MGDDNKCRRRRSGRRRSRGNEDPTMTKTCVCSFLQLHDVLTIAVNLMTVRRILLHPLKVDRAIANISRKQRLNFTSLMQVHKHDDGAGIEIGQPSFRFVLFNDEPRILRVPTYYYLSYIRPTDRPRD